MYLLDTHIILWIDGNIEKLSSNVLNIIDNQNRFFISNISIWEIFLKIKKGKLEFDGDFFEWLDDINGNSSYQLIDPNQQILLKAVNLDWSNNDPADRIIIATGLTKG